MNGERIALRQQRDLGQIVEGAFSLYFQNFSSLFVIASLVVPLGIAGAAFQIALDEPVRTAVVAPLIVVQAGVNILAGAALIAALTDLDEGRPPEFSHAYDVAFARFWTLVAAALRAIFHVLLFAITIIGIPWAIQRGVRWLFIEQAVILEGAGAKSALSTSADAVIGRWWRTLGIAIVIGVITAVPASIISSLLLLAPPLVSGTINAIVNAALLPFGVTAMTLLYLDLKERKESDANPSSA